MLALSILAGLVATAPASGHSERDAFFPDGSGRVPEYRTDGPTLVVCKEDSLERIEDHPADLKAYNLALWDECGFRHIQAAVDAVAEPGTRILVMPGVYHEEPSLAPASPACAPLEDKNVLSYAEHVACPHIQNLITVLGDDPADAGIKCGDSPSEVRCDLQLEGTGESPYDVTVDVAWNKLNGLRADRADGIYVKNMLFQRTEFNSVYILETDGFVIDDAVARWNWEYGFLTFAVDHGLYKDCEAYGNGDAGLYPGSASDLHGVRWAIEITGCDSHHNMAGYSGTAGNSVYAHHNDFHHNAIGVVMDSLFPGHPGLPQDAAKFTHNRIWANNENHYDNFLGEDAPCLRPIPEMGIENGTVCPVAPVPVGSGIMVAGGNNNLFAENWIWDNDRYGYMLFEVPAALRDEHDPAKQLDTSHFNRFRDNHMGHGPDGEVAPNGIDTWWSEGGTGNCWQDNHAPAGWTSTPPAFLLPSCDGMPTNRALNLAKLATIAPCALYDNPDEHHPPGCDWMHDPEPTPLRQLLWYDPVPPTTYPLSAPFSPEEADRVGSVRFGDVHDWLAWWHEARAGMMHEGFGDPLADGMVREGFA